MLMVKPARPYLDVIARRRATRTLAPLAAYQVSGEYAMLKAAAGRGRSTSGSAVLESLVGIKRAGADLVITYYAAGRVAGGCRAGSDGRGAVRRGLPPDPGRRVEPGAGDARGGSRVPDLPGRGDGGWVTTPTATGTSTR